MALDAPEVQPYIPALVRKHLKEVWKAYGHLSASDLERLTHSESPWIKARKGLPPDESSHEIITKDSMREVLLIALAWVASVRRNQFLLSVRQK